MSRAQEKSLLKITFMCDDRGRRAPSIRTETMPKKSTASGYAAKKNFSKGGENRDEAIRKIDWEEELRYLLLSEGYFFAIRRWNQ